MPKATESFQAKFKKFFDACNGGGPVSISDLVRGCREMIPDWSDPEVKPDSEIIKIFVDLDDDGDKQITWEEFCEEMNKKNPKDVTEQELLSVFKEADTDGTGKLNKAEVKAMCENLEIELTEDELETMLSRADPNGDGVDVKEFLAAWKGQ